MGVFYRDYLAGTDHLVDDEARHQVLQSLEGAGVAAGWAVLEATEYFDEEIEEFTKWGVN